MSDNSSHYFPSTKEEAILQIARAFAAGVEDPETDDYDAYITPDGEYRVMTRTAPEPRNRLNNGGDYDYWLYIRQVRNHVEIGEDWSAEFDIMDFGGWDAHVPGPVTVAELVNAAREIAPGIVAERAQRQREIAAEDAVLAARAAITGGELDARLDEMLAESDARLRAALTTTEAAPDA